MVFELLDGSTGYVLLEKGLPEDDLFRQIWSARALVEKKYHSLVKQTHESYLKLGAKYITTNSYATQPTWYEATFGTEEGRRVMAAAMDEESSAEVLELVGSIGPLGLMCAHAKLSAQLAVESRHEFASGGGGGGGGAEGNKDNNNESDRNNHSNNNHNHSNNNHNNNNHNDENSICILGSLPPLVESHRPDLFWDALEAKGEAFFLDNYKDLAKALLEGGADCLVLETMNCWEEAELALRAIRELMAELAGTRSQQKQDVIVSLEGSLRGKDLKPQPHLAPAWVRKVLEFDLGPTARLRGVGFNCAPPEDILESLEHLSTEGVLAELETRDILVMVYANLHERDIYDEGFEMPSVQSPQRPEARKVTRRGDLIETAALATADEQTTIPCAGYVKFGRKITRDFGVKILGGCCGCGPQGIAAIAQHV
ncbi:unnamed protein product [Polarella glacialis]|uniref:Hcy-binding domain-containing protein n=1 Tax=Polarella glacialis TaxID=89957 RepID=A0A813HZY7_POLGL|nr:unnamed protein product [Polarella glacialis]